MEISDYFIEKITDTMNYLNSKYNSNFKTITLIFYKLFLIFPFFLFLEIVLNFLNSKYINTINIINSYYLNFLSIILIIIFIYEFLLNFYYLNLNLIKKLNFIKNKKIRFNLELSKELLIGLNINIFLINLILYLFSNFYQVILINLIESILNDFFFKIINNYNYFLIYFLLLTIISPILFIIYIYFIKFIIFTINEFHQLFLLLFKILKSIIQNIIKYIKFIKNKCYNLFLNKKKIKEENNYEKEFLVDCPYCLKKQIIFINKEDRDKINNGENITHICFDCENEFKFNNSGDSKKINEEKKSSKIIDIDIHFDRSDKEYQIKKLDLIDKQLNLFNKVKINGNFYIKNKRGYLEYEKPKPNSEKLLHRIIAKKKLYHISDFPDKKFYELDVHHIKFDEKINCFTNNLVILTRDEHKLIHKKYIFEFGEIKAVEKILEERKKYNYKLNKKNNLEKIKHDFSNAYKPWTRDEEESLQKLFKKNESIEKISKILLRNEGAIISKLKQIGILEKIDSIIIKNEDLKEDKNNNIYYFLDYFPKSTDLENKYEFERNKILKAKNNSNYLISNYFNLFEKSIHVNNPTLIISPVPSSSKGSCNNSIGKLVKKISSEFNIIDGCSIINRKFDCKKNHLGERRTEKEEIDSLEIKNKELIKDKIIIIIDDITTTGKTLKVIKKLLLNNGAKKVIPIALAKTKH